MNDRIIEIIELDGISVARVVSEEILINETQDALDIMADCSYQGAQHIIIHKHNLVPEFFELRTGIAGEILQKFSNYRARLGIIGDFSNVNSKSLRDFIYESNKTGRIIFASSEEEAIHKMQTVKL